jgi:hypothetical protein
VKGFTAEARWIDETITIAIGQALIKIVPKCKSSPENVAALLGALLRMSAALAIRFDVEQADYMKIARSMFEVARVATREVDEEDDN